MMWEDPIVAEVRRVRAELEEEANGDLAEMFRRAVAFQKEYESGQGDVPARAIEEGERSGRASRDEVSRVVVNKD